jgi:hypothetical protein
MSGEHDVAKKHVVEVGDHELGVGDVEVNWWTGQQHARQAAGRKRT